MINREGDLKIGDFGLESDYGIPIKSYCREVVTLHYRPPDIIMGSKNYSPALDIWSIGCIFAEIVKKGPLFAGSDVED